MTVRKKATDDLYQPADSDERVTQWTGETIKPARVNSVNPVGKGTF